MATKRYTGSDDWTFLSTCAWCHIGLIVRGKHYDQPNHYCGLWHRILDTFVKR